MVAGYPNETVLLIYRDFIVDTPGQNRGGAFVQPLTQEESI